MLLHTNVIWCLFTEEFFIVKLQWAKHLRRKSTAVAWNFISSVSSVQSKHPKFSKSSNFMYWLTIKNLVVWCWRKDYHGFIKWEFWGANWERNFLETSFVSILLPYWGEFFWFGSDQNSLLRYKVVCVYDCH